MTSNQPYDVVVVGGGPAGLAAATWLGRYRRATLLLDSGEYRNASVEVAHGYLGCDPVSPADLRAAAIDQLRAYGSVTRREGRARTATGSIDDFVVGTDAGDVRARRIVLSTGVRDAFPDVDGFFEHYGADVFHCPTCDGYEARGRDVVAFGWSKELTGFALHLMEWAASVTIVTDGRTFEGDGDDRARLDSQGVTVVEDVALELVGRRGSLREVRLRSGAAIPCGLAFFSIAHHPVTGLADQLGCEMTHDGCVEVDDECATSCPGVYAAGDLTPGLQLMQVAAAKGTIAGVACARSLGSSG